MQKGIQFRSGRNKRWIELLPGRAIRTSFAFLILGLLLHFGTASAADEDWTRIENSDFSFSLPSTFKKTEANGIDSFVQEYVADGIKIGFDLGLYSNHFQDWPKETKFESLNVDGLPARIGTVEYEPVRGSSFTTQIYIQLGDGALAMYANCKSQKELALARNIFESIMFKFQHPLLKFYIVSQHKIEGGRFIDTPELRKVGYIAAHPDLIITNIEDAFATKSKESAMIINTYGRQTVVPTHRVTALSVLLQDEDVKRFETLTNGVVGKRMLVMLDEKPLAALKVRDAIPDGTFIIDSRGQIDLEKVEDALWKIKQGKT